MEKPLIELLKLFINPFASMKVLMVLDHEFPPDIRVENEIQALTKSGIEVHIACLTFVNKDAFEIIKNYKVHRKQISKLLHKTSVGALRFPYYFNFWRKFLNKILSKQKFDAIHAHDLPMAQPAYEMAQKYNLKFTLDLHENWPALLRVATHTQSVLGKFLSKNSQWEKYELKYCKLADNVIVVVDEAKHRLVNLGINKEKIHIVSNTLNLDDFNIPEEKPDKEYISILYAGGINKHRGLQTVIKGLKFVENIDKKIRVWILGTGSYVEDLKLLAKDEDVEDKVFFEGWKNYQEMQIYFGKSDICLVPHIKSDHTDSTIPHKIFQYMYAGKPMLVSNCDPLQRIIEESDAGEVFTFDDPKDFASKLQKVVSNTIYFSEPFIKRSKKLVLEKYNWKIDSAKLVRIYN